MQIKNLLEQSLIVVILCGLAACGESEKDVAIKGKPIMTSEEVIAQACTGDYAPKAAMVDACKAEKVRFGNDFAQGANCATLKVVNEKLSAMNREKPGTCMPKIRF